MTDRKKGLPIRTEADGLDERLHVKIVDGTATAVNQMTVDSDKNAHVEAHGNDPGDTDRVIRTSELGSTSVDGVYDVADNTDPSQVGVVGMVRNDTPADSQQTHRVTAVPNSDGSVRSLDIAVHDEDGEPYTDANPMPVYIANDPGIEVHDYNEHADVAADATDDYDYTVPDGDTFELWQVLVSASSRMRMEVIYTTDDFATVNITKAVRFNSTASPEADADWKKPLVLTGSGTDVKIRIRVTNRENQPQSIYTTIVGILKT